MNGNPYTEDEGQISEYLRLALSFLSKHDIPISPINYRLGYDTVSGRIADLSKVLEERASSSEAPMSDRLWELHQRLYTIDSDTLDNIRHELDCIINSTQGDINGSGDSLSDYVTTLNRFATVLGTPQSARAMAAEVELVTKHTLATELMQRNLGAHLAQTYSELESLRKELTQVRDETHKDYLTGIGNRRAFNATLEDVMNRARSTKSTFSILLADIDYFKNVNDGYGHLIGDKVLRFVASTFERSVKGSHTVARIGGEEFAAILPNTDITGAYAVAERVRRAVSNGKIKDINNRKVIDQITISIGVTQFDSHDRQNDVMQRADHALYKAKEMGRNRIEIGRRCDDMLDHFCIDASDSLG